MTSEGKKGAVVAMGDERGGWDLFLVRSSRHSFQVTATYSQSKPGWWSCQCPLRNHLFVYMVHGLYVYFSFMPLFVSLLHIGKRMIQMQFHIFIGWSVFC